MGFYNRFFKRLGRTIATGIRSSLRTIRRYFVRPIIRSGFHLYVSILRKWLSPRLWFAIRNTKYRFVRPPNVWSSYQRLGINQFAQKMEAMPYRGDPLNGLVDYTCYDPNFFFWSGLDKGRDCDDFAYVWYRWAKRKGYRPKMIVMMNGVNISTAHVITVWNNRSSWCIGNNQNYDDGFGSMQDAIEDVKRYTWSGGHHYEDLYWTVY